jgi:hypothetical protein
LPDLASSSPPPLVFRYASCGVELESDVPLSSLPPADGSRPAAAKLTLRTSLAPFEEPSCWLYTERLEATSEPWRAVGVCTAGYLVRLFGHVDFFFEKASREARLFLAPQAPASALEPLFLEQAFPLWLSLLGRPCLHASAVVWGDGARAVAFAGRSRSGKSTLATSLSDAGGLLSDDCLALELAGERVLAHPSHRAVRLLADAAQALFASPTAGELATDGGKRRLEVRGADRALPLARIYMLEPAAGPARAERLRPRDSVARLATHFFRIDPEDRSRLAGELDLLERVALRTPVVRLEVPRRFAALGDVRRVIAEDLAHG